VAIPIHAPRALETRPAVTIIRSCTGGLVAPRRSGDCRAAVTWTHDAGEEVMNPTK
jgi:hypothetical protein